MLKKEINFISDLNINKLQILGDRFTISDLNKSDIHPALLKYVSSSIDYEIFLDKKRIESSSIFNYNSDRISNYFNLIGQEIKKTQNFDFEYIKKLLQSGVIFNINYLSKPNSTLVKSIYGDASIKTIEEIVLKLSNLYYYRYLQKILLTYLDKKQVILMRREEFIELLERIDVISKETHLDNTLSTVINSMANFFDPTAKTTPKIPLISIQQYLDEKNLGEYSAKLFENFGDSPILSISATDALSVLKSVIPESEISIEVESNISESFVEDKNDEEEIAEILEPVETEIIEVDDNLNIIDEEIFTPEEEEIPNSDLLSSDHSELNNNIDVDQVDNLDEQEEKSELDKNDVFDETEKKSESNQEDDQKKKIDINPLVDSLIDINKLYNSLHSKTIPFNHSLKERIIEFLNKEDGDELNYKLDISTLSEELPIISSTNNSVEDNEKNDLENEFDSFEFSDINIEQENENSDDGESLDYNEINFLKGNDINLSIEEDEEEITNNEFIDESKLVLSEEDDEELTEVFTDLIYLNEEKIEQNEEIKILNDLKEKPIETPHQINDNFEEIIVSKDMTKIIENVFDYDMEDYHTLMNKISGSDNEMEALKIIEDYCKTNHVEIKSGEVETLKSIIAEYFTQTYS